MIAEQPCGKPAATFRPRAAESFACVLPPGHDGECQPGGICYTHGAYVGKPGVLPSCPKCPTWKGVEV